jgi:septin family protein
LFFFKSSLKNNIVNTTEKTVEINVQAVDLEEKGVRLRLTIVDTPGFGDLINAHRWYLKQI